MELQMTNDNKSNKEGETLEYLEVPIFRTYGLSENLKTPKNWCQRLSLTISEAKHNYEFDVEKNRIKVNAIREKKDLFSDHFKQACVLFKVTPVKTEIFLKRKV